MAFRAFLLLICFAVLTAFFISKNLPLAAEPKKDDKAAPAEKVVFSKHIAPLLTKYCISCHGGEKPKADLALDKLEDHVSPDKHRELWEKVAKNVRTREMPAGKGPKPTQAEIDLLTSWIDVQIAKVDCTGQRDPGRVTIRRLNRAEYNNTIRDLVGVDFKPADDFPADDVGYGFDNIGDVLSLSPLLTEKYLAAAEKIIEEAFKKEETKKRIMILGPNDPGAPRRILRNFGDRAYRRPITRDEVNRLMTLVELAERRGDTFETGIQLACQAMLVSPHFLYKVEIDPEPKNPNAIHPISDYELATRMSYFLWSSMPDEELFKHAREGTLRKPEVLEEQVKRMLKDPKARALVDNFAGQWLQIRNLKTLAPDADLFPTFNEKLRSAMIQETELFFDAVIREDRSILEFLDADFTFVNEPLAKHYGIKDVTGDEFQRVSVKGTARGGLLTQASILTLTSNPTRTSPVKRGKWILETILGTPPPPPPPDAGELSEEKEAVLSGSLRQRMEQHRSNPSCAICHQRMDPIGFGFENFDAVGAWRTKDGKFAIDPSGTLPDGKSFK